MLLAKWNRQLQEHLTSNSATDFVKCNVGMSHLTRPVVKASNLTLNQLRENEKRKLFDSIPKVEASTPATVLLDVTSAYGSPSAVEGKRPTTKESPGRPSTRGTSLLQLPSEEGGSRKRLTDTEKKLLTLRM